MYSTVVLQAPKKSAFDQRNFSKQNGVRSNKMQTMCLIGPTMWEHSIRVSFNIILYLYLVLACMLDTIALRQESRGWYPTPTPIIGGWHRRTTETSNKEGKEGKARNENGWQQSQWRIKP
jgi:hypothetical protein